MAMNSHILIECILYRIGCPSQYKLVSKSSADVCLENLCPIPSDMGLEECRKSCNEMKQCHLFRHVKLEKYRQCFLYGYDEGNGTISDNPCGNNVGNTCCEKGKLTICQ